MDTLFMAWKALTGLPLKAESSNLVSIVLSNFCPHRHMSPNSDKYLLENITENWNIPPIHTLRTTIRYRLKRGGRATSWLVAPSSPSTSSDGGLGSFIQRVLNPASVSGWICKG
jgi:hypothetical protein